VSAVIEKLGKAAQKPEFTDPNRVIASLVRDQVNLELKTVDLCFLTGLYLKADKAALASFEEDVLIDTFEQVCDFVEPGAENPRKRATHAIQRLREQRMLARVDGTGLVRAGDYTLTTLAAAVVQYFLTDEALTRESLTLLTGTLNAQISEILAAAKKAMDDESWLTKVSGPLRITVSELVSGIERRQRGLDAQQEEMRAEIAKLLQSDWFSAIERCQLLLDDTTSTLDELNVILLRDTHLFVAQLQDIQALASDAGSREAEETAQRVIENVDRIAAWGRARQQAWSEYYQYVHRYLRDVVRLDPDRALSQRLRDQTAGWPASRFYLLVAHAPPIQVLRALEAHIERPPVARTRTEREDDPEWVEPEDVHADIKVLASQAIDEGAATLAEVSSRVLSKLPEPLHYAAAGRVADAVGRLARVRSEHERPWTSVSSRLEIEDWALDGRSTP